MKRRLSTMSSALVALLSVLLAAWLAWTWHGVSLSLDPVTDPAQYQNVLSDLAKNGYPYVRQFPAAIPQSATHVSFFYQPGALQGAAQIYLRYAIPAHELEATIQSISRPTTKPTVPEYPRFRPLPPGFQIISLVVKEDASGNHGHDYGIAVDSTSAEIIYFAEEW